MREFLIMSLYGDSRVKSETTSHASVEFSDLRQAIVYNGILKRGILASIEPVIATDNHSASALRSRTGAPTQAIHRLS